MITGYEITSGMELRAEETFPLWVRTKNLTEN